MNSWIMGIYLHSFTNNELEIFNTARGRRVVAKYPLPFIINDGIHTFFKRYGVLSFSVLQVVYSVDSINGYLNMIRISFSGI